MFACSIVKSELAYGAFKSQNPDRTYRKQQQFLSLFVSLPFDDAAALVFGRLNAQLEAIMRNDWHQRFTDRFNCHSQRANFSNS